MGGWLDPQRIARLRQKQETTFVPIFLHRPIAILLLIPLADIQWITPNRLTTVSILLRLFVAYLIWPESMGGPVESIGVIWTAIGLWHLGSALDAADGTLARYRGQTSLFGRYYDKVSDRITTLSIVLALAARVYVQTQEVLYVMLAMIYVALISATGVAKWIDLGLRVELQEKNQNVSDPNEVPAPQRSLRGWLYYILTRLSFAIVVTELDLPLWGSIAMLTHREDWLFIYLGVFIVPYSFVALGKRGYLIYRDEKARLSKR